MGRVLRCSPEHATVDGQHAPARAEEAEFGLSCDRGNPLGGDSLSAQPPDNPCAEARVALREPSTGNGMSPRQDQREGDVPRLVEDTAPAGGPTDDRDTELSRLPNGGGPRRDPNSYRKSLVEKGSYSYGRKTLREKI